MKIGEFKKPLIKYMESVIRDSSDDSIEKSSFNTFRENPNIDFFIHKADMLYYLYQNDNAEYEDYTCEFMYNLYGFVMYFYDHKGIYPEHIDVYMPECLDSAMSSMVRFAHEAYNSYEKGESILTGKYIMTAFCETGLCYLYQIGQFKNDISIAQILEFCQK